MTISEFIENYREAFGDVAPLPIADKTGNKNLNVEPLSLQSKSGLVSGLSIGEIS